MKLTKENKETLIQCLLMTFLWGMVAHAYIFFNNSFSHDSLNGLNAEIYGHHIRIQYGRVFVPAYRVIVRGVLALPWLLGLLSLLYTSLAVFLIVKMFNISLKRRIFLIAGIFTTNLTVTATAATYIHDLDCNMLAMLLSVLAVYLWKTHKRGYLYGMLPIGFSLGIYQSFVSVTIVLIMIVLICDLLDGEKFKTAFFRGLYGIAMLIGGGAFYFICMKVICFATGIELVSGNYNSIDTVLFMSAADIVKSVGTAYMKSINTVVNVVSYYSKNVTLLIHLLIIGGAGVLALPRLFTKKTGILEKLLIAALLLLLPMGMNISQVLTNGMSHELMLYAVWMVYLLALLITWQSEETREWKQSRIVKGLRLAVCILMFTVLWSNVQVSNASYLKKDMEYDANLSLFTRIMYRLEDHEDYETGKTKVVFVGTPTTVLKKVRGFDDYYRTIGMARYYVVGTATRSHYARYFDYVLANPIVLAGSAEWNALQKHKTVASMPCYPEDGCIQMVDGCMVVKLGNVN